MIADRRTRTRTFLIIVCGLALAGCASMPSDGGVREVPPSQPRADSGLRVYAAAPEPGAGAERIVNGFLEALMSDDFRTAAGAYLVKEKRAGWRPGATTVLAETPTVKMVLPTAREPERSSDVAEVRLLGEKIATVSESGTYQPATDSDYDVLLKLRKQRGEWRIAEPPPGLVLGQAVFQRNYRSVNTYFFTERSQRVLVADPVFVRKRIDPVTESVRALLDGPGPLLDGYAETDFPEGALLGTRGGLALNEDNALKLPLKLPVRPDLRHCRGMAAQVLHTVQSQEGLKVSKVQLVTEKDTPLCDLSSAAAKAYAPEQLAKRPRYQYFVDGEHQLVKLNAGPVANVQESEVMGPLGDGQVRVDAAAVARSEREAAAVSGGRRLYVAPIDGTGKDEPETVLTSGEKKPTATSGLTAPSWDGLGDLWVADRVGGESRLYVLKGGTGKPQTVSVEGLGDGRIDALRVSADGSRVAMLVSVDGHSRLMLGAIAMVEGTPAVRRLTEAAPQLKDVRAVSWAGDSRLVVVGREELGQELGLQEMRYVTTDGWMDAELGRGLTGVAGVAASEDDSKALVAASDDGIVRLPPDAYWKPVVKEGMAPVYPG